MKRGDNHFGGEQGVYCPPLLTPPWETGAMTKGECTWEGTRSHATGLVAYLGGPLLYHIGMQNLIAWGSQGFGSDVRGGLVELAGKHHGWFSDGIRFPSPLTMPNLVAFLDQAPCIT